MDVVIVGHGPSLLERKCGEQIDEFDFVVRLKRCADLFRYPEQYGTKKSAVCGSWTIRNQLTFIEADQIWVFLDSRHDNVRFEEIAKAKRSLPCEILPGTCSTWNNRYRERRTEYEMPDGMRKFTPIGHPHLSAGFHSLVYACTLLEPDSVTLAGFDNIESGKFTWSVTRGPDYDQYPDHRWDIEHEMIDDVERVYDTRVDFL